MMKELVETLAQAHPESDVFISQVIMVPQQGHLILYDVGTETHVANVIGGVVQWAHPFDFDVAFRRSKPVAPEENIGSCEPGPDLRKPLWDKNQGTWFTDVDKVGRYSVSRPRKRAPYSAFLNGKDLGLLPSPDPEVLKQGINRRILEARRINRDADRRPNSEFDGAI